MHVRSNLDNGNPGQDVPVALFSLSDSHKYLALETDYRDMIDTVKRKFNTKEGYALSLFTSGLNTCRGCEVEVDESAYPYLVGVLDQLRIECTEGPEPLAVVLQDVARSPKGKSPALSPPDADSEDDPEFERVTRPASRASSVTLKPSHKSLAAGSVKNSSTSTGSRTAAHAISKKTSKSDFKKEPTSERPPSVSRKVRPSDHDRENEVPRAKEQKFRAATRPKTMTQSIPERRETVNATQASSQPEEARFKIHITLGPERPGEPEISGEFKTRGSHQIKKVLFGACRTFNVGTKGMALWKPEVDDDGETAWHECEPEDTVAQAGLVDGDKLMLEAREEDLEDESEEE